MGIEKITDRIAAEAKADYDAVVGSAKQEARSILADAKAAAEKILAGLAEEEVSVDSRETIRNTISRAAVWKTCLEICSGICLAPEKRTHKVLIFMAFQERLFQRGGLTCRRKWK